MVLGGGEWFWSSPHSGPRHGSKVTTPPQHSHPNGLGQRITMNPNEHATSGMHHNLCVSHRIDTVVLIQIDFDTPSCLVMTKPHLVLQRRRMLFLSLTNCVFFCVASIQQFEIHVGIVLIIAFDCCFVMLVRMFGSMLLPCHMTAASMRKLKIFSGNNGFLVTI
jgi:hypothetical protein